MVRYILPFKSSNFRIDDSYSTVMCIKLHHNTYIYVLSIEMSSWYITLSTKNTLSTASETGIICEELPRDLCAFSISSSGRRCVLESSINGEATRYLCHTSEVVVTNYMADWIETDECVSACDLDRNTVGISSDALLERNFRKKLCSTACYANCPNIVDLYTNLASGEGENFMLNFMS